MLKRLWLFIFIYIMNIVCIYGVLVLYIFYMNFWVLDEWLCYELLWKIIEYIKYYICIWSIDVLLWIYDYGVIYILFLSSFLEEN